MDLGLRDKVVVVTGASQGIGLAVARAFREEGARVVAGARRSSPELDALSAQGAVVPVAVDLTEPDGPALLVERAVRTFGGLDALVNNLGAGAVPACRAALPALIERGSGAIVNLASVNSFQPDPSVADYCAAKAALASLSKALSMEFGPKRIRVTRSRRGRYARRSGSAPPALPTRSPRRRARIARAPSGSPPPAGAGSPRTTSSPTRMRWPRWSCSWPRSASGTSPARPT